MAALSLDLDIIPNANTQAEKLWIKLKLFSLYDSQRFIFIAITLWLNLRQRPPLLSDKRQTVYLYRFIC